MWIAVNHHRTHKNKPITFDRHYYLRDLYLDQSDWIDVIKATQSGVSEWLVTIAIGEASEGRSIFYVLPTDQLKNRFVQNRFDRSVNFTPYYQQLLKESNNPKSAESVSLKHIAMGAIAFAGSNTPNPFTEYPADTLIIDELDRCDQENIAMGEERLSASEEARRVYVSNPTIPNFGIDKMHKDSDQKVWMIKHDCGHYMTPDWWRHAVEQVDVDNYVLRDRDWDKSSTRDINFICDKCGRPFDRFSDGEWIETENSYKSGYHISKMFSTFVTVTELVERFSEGLISDYKMQRFYNGDLGVAYIPKGATVDMQMLNEIKGDYLMPSFSERTCVAGIDVGMINHVVISEIMEDSKLKVVNVSAVADESDLYDLIRRYNVRSFVVDAMPETRMSKRLCMNTGRGFMCYYATAKGDLTFVPKTRIINANRTVTLDAIKERIIAKDVVLPSNADAIPEFYEHMTSSIRVFDEDYQKYNWVCGNGKDHYFHAFGYMLLARRILVLAQR